MSEKLKVLYFLERYAQISETYIENEIKYLANRYKIRILSLQNPDLRQVDHLKPYTIVRTREHVLEVGGDFGPDVLHGHYLTLLERMFSISQMLQAPFTLRAHSFDVLGTSRAQLAEWSKYANAENCLGILTFPFTIPWLVEAGYSRNKLIPCWPVVDVAAFANREPNGDAVMNTGAALPKKGMEDFIRLASLLPERQFDLYPLGYDVAHLVNFNRELGSPVNIMRPLQPSAMPAEYKRHQWLVYTANFEMKTVGWPLSVAEAQASGVGVCVANIRPDLKDYLGGCGFLYDSIEDAARIVAQPFPEELRQRGFELASRSDVRRHIHLLEDLWPRPAQAGSSPSAAAKSAQLPV